jgi:urea transport system permease protein
MAVAFVGAALVGALVQGALTRRLAAWWLDTLLATWGASLVVQQGVRDLFGAFGVEVRAPEWLGGGVALGAVCRLPPGCSLWGS